MNPSKHLQALKSLLSVKKNKNSQKAIWNFCFGPLRSHTKAFPKTYTLCYLGAASFRFSLVPLPLHSFKDFHTILRKPRFYWKIRKLRKPIFCVEIRNSCKHQKKYKKNDLAKKQNPLQGPPAPHCFGTSAEVLFFLAYATIGRPAPPQTLSLAKGFPRAPLVAPITWREVPVSEAYTLVH